MTAEGNEIVLRPARAEDFEFWRHLHREAFRTYVEQTWGRWDEAEQLERLQKEFDPMPGQIVLLAGAPIGFFWLTDHDTYLFLESIAILPEYQNRGLGTRLIQQLLAKADAKAIPVQLSVLKVNPARTLYERLGFRLVGEDEQRWYMERAARGSPDRLS